MTATRTLPPHVAENAAWSTATPVLSVLIPFMRDDPTPLLAALDREGRRLGGRAEVVLLDDGGGDEALTARAEAALQGFSLPARLVTLHVNEGRARGRNRLAAHARAPHLLFLDADMLPDGPAFLAAYLDRVERDDPAVVFGGFSVIQAAVRPEHALHRHMAQESDCLNAARRAERPEKYIFTSNLLIRRDVFEAETFDEQFTGWGWEDVEWGVRVGRRWPIEHIDNTATHLGLDTAAALIGKYRQSARNFARLSALHPDIVRGYPSYRIAKTLRRVPGRSVWRPVLAAVARLEAAPMRVRATALKLYRCALYADVL